MNEINTRMFSVMLSNNSLSKYFFIFFKSDSFKWARSAVFFKTYDSLSSPNLQKWKVTCGSGIIYSNPFSVTLNPSPCKACILKASSPHSCPRLPQARHTLWQVHCSDFFFSINAKEKCTLLPLLEKLDVRDRILPITVNYSAYVTPFILCSYPCNAWFCSMFFWWRSSISERLHNTPMSYGQPVALSDCRTQGRHWIYRSRSRLSSTGTGI